MSKYQEIAATLAMVLLASFMFISQASAQTCEALPEDEGGSHYILIDDEINFYTSLNEASEIQRKLMLMPLLEEEIELLSTQVDACSRASEGREEIIMTLERELEYQRELVGRATELKRSWLENPQLNLAAGFVLGAVVVGAIYHFK